MIYQCFSVKLLAIISLVALLVSVNSVADEPKASTSKGGLYLGVKAIFNELKPEGTDNAGGVGIMIADHYHNGFGMEAEVSRSKADVNLLDLAEDYTLDAAGLYGVYRSPGAFYVKVRGGVVWKRLAIGDESSTRTTFGGGAGIGYDFGRVLLEGEYAYVDKDVAQWGLSVIGKF
ncbi:outer membrane beta-barrel protein [Simiduia curdlanivorans]|uniref:Outer membrane beta-barrel protein n=1 Tax=Simiduia curdlanivorans TaxID=1492769 RepID=A0ABV8V643_9GAMM|nr:outer membrane beta-barrel protein [Simiduia curdlanivorans]MDN3640568.1 outer membrane beta-barrel protein [Simiduia curdlanivorans]